MKNIRTIFELRKFLIIIVVNIILVLYSHAQISVPMSDIQAIFMPGTHAPTYTTNIKSVHVGQTGGPNMYDFSSIIFTDTGYTYFRSVSLVPELIGRYPSTAMMLGSSDQTISNNHIMEFSADQLLSYGEVSIFSDSLRYIHRTPVEPVVLFPAVYNASWSASFAKTDTTYVRGTPTIISSQNINKSMIVDGYGTLKIFGFELPCLRLKRTLTFPLPGDIEFWYLTREGALVTISTVDSQSDTGTVQISSMGLFLGGSLVDVHNSSFKPRGFSLSQNYPNPFNPSTNMSFTLPSKVFVSLKVFDIIGREAATIVSEEMPAGNYAKQWNAVNMSSGVYFYRLQAGTYTETRKLVLLK